MTRIDPSSFMAMRNSILQQNSALQKAASAPGGAAAPVTGVAQADFTKAMSSALSEVNGLQAKASSAADAYERGESNDIAAVMLAREQASVGFQATLQVRNKLLAAYKDIMSMPV
ncbi:MAG: flagellar hook-basal body complex subunit FliE [Sphingomonas bacterium]|jgi:flagellar hook-basal body complex protein FliE|nr:flagellar hook-basal body complex subunit FliE [Sphingomonas bacterium]